MKWYKYVIIFIIMTRAGLAFSQNLNVKFIDNTTATRTIVNQEFGTPTGYPGGYPYPTPSSGFSKWLIQFYRTSDSVIDPMDGNGNPTGDDIEVISVNYYTQYLGFGPTGFINMMSCIFSSSVSTGNTHIGDKIYIRIFNANTKALATKSLALSYPYTITSAATQNIAIYPNYGWGAWSSPPFPPNPAAPVSPVNLYGKQPFISNLSWTCSTGGIPSGYRVYLGTDNPPTNIINGTTQTGTSIATGVLEQNQTYYWKVIPYNSLGDATDCPIWSFTTYKIDLSFPNGGEVWRAGRTQTIRWSTDNPPTLMKCYISLDGATTWNLESSVESNKGYYYIYVPFVDTDQCLIKMTDADNESNECISDSVFSISTSTSIPKIYYSYSANTPSVYYGVGQVMNIEWGRILVTNVDVDYSLNDGVIWTRIASNLDANSVTWVIPDSITHECRIRISSSSDHSLYDMSYNVYHISKIHLLQPTGGNTITGDYSGGTTYTITWSEAGMDAVKIEYSNNNGIDWSTIISSTPAASGNYVWIVSGIPTSRGLIRISSIENNNICDSSSTPFTIQNPLRIANANGGKFVTTNSLFELRWLNQDVDSLWNIWWEYSTNNSTWTRINTTSVAVTEQSMFWFVNTGIVSNMWLRALETSSNRVIGKSETPFFVTNKTLSLSAPVGVVDFSVSTIHTISWECLGLTNLNIDLSLDGGFSWNRIENNVPSANGEYEWTIPDTPSMQCRLKLTDATFAYMNVDSEINFTISPYILINPNVDFVADITSAEIPLTIHFTESVLAGVGHIIHRMWSFGDGDSTNVENPSHTYTIAGNYTVSLHVINQFGGETTFVRDNYIHAHPNVPRISLLTPNLLSFGIIYLGDTSPIQTIYIKNSGSAVLTVSSCSFFHSLSQFSIVNTPFPIEVNIGDSTSINIVYIPAANSLVSDSLIINSNAANDNSLGIRLTGTGQYVPLKAPENVQLTMHGQDNCNALITWDEVTQTIYNSPITPDFYFIYFNGSGDDDPNGLYYFLGRSFATQFTHNDVGLGAEYMFYRVKAIKIYNRETRDLLMSQVRRGMTEAEVDAVLSQ